MSCYEETHNLLDADAISAMKQGAIPINTGRGAVVDVDAALQALASGSLGGLGLDVLPREPLAPESAIARALQSDEPYFSGRLLVTSHGAFNSVDGGREMRERSVQTALRYFASGALRNCVNREFLRSMN